MKIIKQLWGKTDGKDVFLYTLFNANGLVAKITNYGGILTSLLIPDKEGTFEDVVIGFDNLEDYVAGHPNFGVIVGRFANRIAYGRFTIDDQEYQLACNLGEHHLHGGNKGFASVVWDSEMIEGKDSVALRLTYLSKDGEEGYPANLRVSVTYRLNNQNELSIAYQAQSDAKTHVNLTQHSYFNLAGKGDIFGHSLKLNADRYTSTYFDLIPTGNLENVAGTELDFRVSSNLGARIKSWKRGYDHNFVINKGEKTTQLAAEVYEPVSGRMMEVWTTQPAVQFYTANFEQGIEGKQTMYTGYCGFCLECQHFPDSPNQPNFPSTLLYPDQIYQHQSIYKFSC